MGMLQLRNCTALITEAETSFAQVAAERFLREGATLFLTSAQQSALESLLVKLEPLLKKGQRILTQCGQLRAELSVHQIFAFCEARLEHLDILVHRPTGPWELDPMLRLAIQWMQRQKRGHLFLIAENPSLPSNLSSLNIQVTTLSPHSLHTSFEEVLGRSRLADPV